MFDMVLVRNPIISNLQWSSIKILSSERETRSFKTTQFDI